MKRRAKRIDNTAITAAPAAKIPFTSSSSRGSVTGLCSSVDNPKSLDAINSLFLLYKVTISGKSLQNVGSLILNSKDDFASLRFSALVVSILPNVGAVSSLVVKRSE